MVKIEGVSTLNLARINQEPSVGATISKKMETAPKLGFGNAFLIGLKALRQSATGEKTFAAIRSELKKQVLDTKFEQRIEKLAQKFGQTNEQKVALKADLRDQVLARKLGLPTEQTYLSQSVNSEQMRKLGINYEKAKSDFGVFLPDAKTLKTPSDVKAHYSNFIDRVQKEFDSKGVPQEGRVPLFKQLFADFVAVSLNLTDVNLLDQSQIDHVITQFGDEHRTEKQEFMQEIKDVLSGLGDSDSDLSKKIAEHAKRDLKRHLGDLTADQPTNFLRDTGADQINMMIYNKGGDKLVDVSKDLSEILFGSRDFESLANGLGRLSDTPNKIPMFKDPSITPGLVTKMGDITMQFLKDLKDNNNRFNDLRNAVTDFKNLVVDEVVKGNISEAVAQRAMKLFGDSSIILRFVVPHVSSQGVDFSVENNRSRIVLGQFMQAVANGNDAPKPYSEQTKNEYNTQFARVKQRMGEFLRLLEVPTPDQLSQDIMLKRMGGPVNNPPQVNNGDEPNTDNAPKKTDGVKGSSKPETNKLAKTNTSNEKDDIDENLGDLKDIDDEIDDDFDNIDLDNLNDDESDDEVDEETLKFQELADKKKLLTEQDESDDLTDLLDNLRQTPMSEEDKKHLEDIEKEFNEIMNSDK